MNGVITYVPMDEQYKIEKRNLKFLILKLGVLPTNLKLCIESIFLAKRWRYSGDILDFKMQFLINALYQQTDETLVLSRPEFHEIV